LDHAAGKAAQAFADNDRDYLVSLAEPGTAEDVGRWFDEAHPGLEKARQNWQGRKEEIIEAPVHKEDQPERKGEATISIHPAAGPRDVWLANPAAATAPADAPFDTYTIWTLSHRGRWRLDGHATYARAHGAPGS